MTGGAFEIRSLATRGDDRGLLVVAEVGRECPFAVARVYWVFGTREGVRRGFHAHKRTRQMAVCVAGGCSFLMDNGGTSKVIRMQSPDQALMIEPGVWHEMFDFTADCVLLVLADTPYEEPDYIRNYDQFRAFTRTT
ncbi:MAG: FdtA/QdtA family cupin domain-containing protein [Verrucomicrobiota bacterium]